MRWASIRIGCTAGITFPSVTVLRVSMRESLEVRSGVWSTNLQHSSTILATAWKGEGRRARREREEEEERERETERERGLVGEKTGPTHPVCGKGSSPATSNSTGQLECTYHL